MTKKSINKYDYNENFIKEIFSVGMIPGLQLPGKLSGLVSRSCSPGSTYPIELKSGTVWVNY